MYDVVYDVLYDVFREIYRYRSSECTTLIYLPWVKEAAEKVPPLVGWVEGKGIDILETRSSPHKGTAIADITSKMITEMAYRW